MKWNILLIDDDEDDYVLMQEMLNQVMRIEWEVHWAQTYDDGLEALKGNEWSAALVDYDLGWNTGVELIREAVAAGVETPMIMTTGRGRYEVDVEAMEAGASDYVTKAELDSAGLERVIRYAIRDKEREDELEQRVKERTIDLQVTTESLQTSLEEVRVMEEELKAQHENTVHSYQELARVVEQLQARFDLAPEAYLVTDKNGMIYEANQAAKNLLYIHEISLPKPLVVYLSPQEKGWFLSLQDQLSKGRHARGLKFEVHPREGESLPCRLSISVYEDNGERTILWLIVPDTEA